MIIPTLIDDYNEEDLPWLIEGFLCPTLTVISAQPKHGKSTLAGHIATSLINQTPLIGREVIGSAHSVGWMGFDAGWKQETKNNWCKKAERRIYFYDSIRSHEPDRWKELLESLHSYGVTVLIIDHLNALAGTLSLNDAENVSRLMELIRPIHETGIAVILLCQSGKNNQNAGRLAHSVSIEAEARALVQIYDKKNNGRRKVKLISNSRGEEVLNVILTPEEFTLSQVITDKKTTVRESPDRVRKFLAQADPEALTSWQSAGRELARLHFTKNEAAGRSMTTRWRKQGLLKEEDGRIVAGDSLLNIPDADDAYAVRNYS